MMNGGVNFYVKTLQEGCKNVTKRTSELEAAESGALSHLPVFRTK